MKMKVRLEEEMKSEDAEVASRSKGASSIGRRRGTVHSTRRGQSLQLGRHIAQYLYSDLNVS